MRQQLVYRRLAADREQAEAVLGALSSTAWIARTNLEASHSIAKTVTNLKRTVPAWRIEPPPAPEVLQGFYQEAEAVHGVPWEVLAAIHLVETRMGRLRGTSWAGARGPMQFIPETWARFGSGDIESPRDAILAAGHYLARMGAERDLAKAIWHYNQSDAYVRSVLGYASVLEKNPVAYQGYWGWQVYYRTRTGVVLLPEGYAEVAPVPVEAWCLENDRYCP
jgi:membrane-bound lytic murein transglycosylase B